MSYRDKRTENIDKIVSEIISDEKLYKKTGIQKQNFNTLYQLMSIKINNPEYLKKADCMLLIPDYFNYLLTGIKQTEYTNATTTQLVNAETKAWDNNLIDLLGFNRNIFPKINNTGSVIGNLTEEIQKEIGFNCKVINPATHDTGSAVLAVPSENEDNLYISSGTWSLMGTELNNANLIEESRIHNFTNEGGYNYKFRYLKNIMGLWMIQSIKKEIGSNYSFEEICSMASNEKIDSIVDCNDKSFLAPESMVKAIQEYCKKTKQTIPNNIKEISCVVYNSLAKLYADTTKEIELLTNKHYKTINIIGGGANAEYLNKLTAKYTKKQVTAGPVEATSIGNLIVQMIANKELTDLKEAKRYIKNSFNLKIYNSEN